MANILQGDCLDKLKELEDNSVDSVVTDPPYELGFRGKAWDGSGIANNPDMWAEVLRVLKPGGHLLSFSGTRTYHRQAVAIEDSGFEIRDMVEWVYGSGFPKSHNIGKAVDKLEGNEIEDMGYKTRPDGIQRSLKAKNNWLKSGTDITQQKETKGTSPWEGWGTALKPAHEPICLARKPFKGTVAKNVLKHGTGGLNIDKSRVGDEPGRFPANLLHDGSDEVVREFPNSKSVGGNQNNRATKDSFISGVDKTVSSIPGGYLDDGSASRFFKSFLYCPKASKSERDRGCEGMEEKQKIFNGQSGESNKDMNGVEQKFTTQPARNNHPTVKPLALMKYLIQMITPEGGVVLDPFAGSGSTLVATKELGYDFIGIEREEEYIEIIKARLDGVKDTLI